MKTSELRIGNLVQTNDSACNCESGTVLTVNSIGLDVDFKNGTTQYYFSIEGIRLTEEWLVKFGFEKNLMLGDEDLYDYDLHKKGFEITFEFNCGIIDGCCLESVGIDITNVHQLQNLYFALIGEELTIKE